MIFGIEDFESGWEFFNDPNNLFYVTRSVVLDSLEYLMADGSFNKSSHGAKIYSEYDMAQQKCINLSSTKSKYTYKVEKVKKTKSDIEEDTSGLSDI